MPNKIIPSGWEETPLGELGKYINGRAFKPSDWEKDGLPIIRIQNLTNSSAPFNYYSKPVEEKYYVHNGDLLISWSASLGAYIWERGDAILNQHIFRVEVNSDKVDKMFLKYSVQYVLEQLKKQTHGATMRHITKGDFDSFTIPVPRSLEEQRKIVLRLETLLREVKSARELQDSIEEEINLLVDAVLSEIFASRDQWQNEQDLAELVSIEAPLVDPRDPEYSNLPHIYGASIESGTGRLLNYQSAAEDGMTSNKYLFEPGVVLYSKIRPYLRKVTIADFKGVCSADMYPLTVTSVEILPEFLMWTLLSPEFTEFINAFSLRARIPKVNREQLMAYRMRYPDINSQKGIAAYIQNWRDEVGEMQRAQRENAELLEQTEQSLLAQAFRGEL